MTPADRPQRSETLAVVLGAIACLVALAVAVPRTVDDTPKDPSWSASLDDLPAGTKVVDDWGGGGYFMWRWPQLDLVMNGYGDIYTDDELDRNYPHRRDQPRLAGLGAVDRRALCPAQTGLQAGLRARGARGLEGAAPQRRPGAADRPAGLAAS